MESNALYFGIPVMLFLESHDWREEWWRFAEVRCVDACAAGSDPTHASQTSATVIGVRTRAIGI
jgi:hypothetical protein